MYQIISKGERNRVLKNGIDQLKKEGWALEYRGVEAPTAEFCGEICTAFAVLRRGASWGTLRRGKYTNGFIAAWHHSGSLDDGYKLAVLEMC